MNYALSSKFLFEISCHTVYTPLELCDNLDNKIIETINFIMIKIIAFYYRNNNKFLDISVYYTKTNSLVPGAIMEQDMHIYCYVICCYCIKITVAIHRQYY